MVRKITFVLPAPANTPCGGYKVVYEYANRLYDKGFDVSIGFDCRFIGTHIGLSERLRCHLAKFVGKWRCKRYPNWFPLNEKISKFCIFKVTDKIEADIIVATELGTVDIVCSQRAGKKLYLIQGFENWSGVTDSQVYKSYLKISNRIVIADWLLKKVEQNIESGKTILIPNGIEHAVFKCCTAIEKRNENIVAMLYHPAEYKGSKFGLAAIEKVKKKLPDLKAVIFGVPERPAELPSWMQYKRNVSQLDLCDIYNKSKVFVLPSIEEGFGLTGLESMACGCALCTSDYQGVHEFAMNNVSALMSAPKDSEKMAKNLYRLLTDETLRIRIAEAGNKKAQTFTWDRSVDSFISFMKQCE